MEKLMLEEYNGARLDLNSIRPQEYQVLIKYHRKQIEILKLLRLSIDNKQFTTDSSCKDLDDKISMHRHRMESIITKYIKVYTTL